MTDHVPRRQGRPRRACLPLLLLAAVAGAISLTSCEFLPGTVVQGSGLPTLRHLSWGYPYFDGATWSPNGRWIALWAGEGVGQTHLVVLAADGRHHWDLRAWDCNNNEDPSSLAWLPDSSLSCMTTNTSTLVIGAYPFTSPTTVLIQPMLTSAGKGATWTPDGTQCIMASLTDPTDPAHMVQNGALYRVERSGVVASQALTPKDDYVEDPVWVPSGGSSGAPGGASLSYLMQTDPNTGLLNLLLSTVTIGAQGAMTLGAPQTLATDVDEYYAWSPSGRWIAVRHGDYRGGDTIYLLNPANPTQTVDVVVADRVGQQMIHPIWSPDGNTLIVFSVAYNASQPYAIDIGAYLRGKGLQP